MEWASKLRKITDENIKLHHCQSFTSAIKYAFNTFKKLSNNEKVGSLGQIVMSNYRKFERNRIKAVVSYKCILNAY